MEVYHGTFDLDVSFTQDKGADLVDISGLEVASIRGGVGYLKVPATGGTFMTHFEPLETLSQSRSASAGGVPKISALLPKPVPTSGYLYQASGGGAFQTNLVISQQDGILEASALMIEGTNGKSYIVYLFRPPTALSIVPQMPTVGVAHGNDRADLKVLPIRDGLSIDVMLQGYEEFELSLNRVMQGMATVDAIAKGAKSTTVGWKPAVHQFSLAAVFESHGSKVDDALKVFHVLGARDLTSDLMGVHIDREYFFCDGPGFAYNLVLKCRRTLGSDTASMSLSMREP